MLAKTRTCAVAGLDGVVVEVEVDISPGMPAFNIVGLPDTAVQESRERVRAAIRNSGNEFPIRRITVGLAPADVKKSGPSYDLPIAMGILLSTGQIPDRLNGALLLGELALDGKLRATQGILPMVAVGRSQGYRTVFVPTPNADEAALVGGVTVMPVDTLGQLVSHVRSETMIGPFHSNGRPKKALDEEGSRPPDLADVRGQEHAKRAVEVAAAGGHNLLWL